MPLPEVATSSAWCQRWRHGQHSFVRTSAGGFDPQRYQVHAVSESVAKSYVVTHHYSGTYPAAMYRYGMFLDVDGVADLVGVAVFSVPAQLAVITNVFPDLDYSNACELGRLVLEGPPASQTGGVGLAGGERAPANSESWFVSRCLEDLAVRGVRGVISFADPVPRRRADGTVVLAGHVGTTYAACNFRYTGRGTPRRLTLAPDGTTLNDRALQKVRRQERGHDYVERRLVALGAHPRRDGQDPTGWLRDALDTIGVRRIAHRGNHRYVVAVGTTRSERRSVRITPDSVAYPKRRDDG